MPLGQGSSPDAYSGWVPGAVRRAMAALLGQSAGTNLARHVPRIRQGSAVAAGRLGEVLAAVR